MQKATSLYGIEHAMIVASLSEWLSQTVVVLTKSISSKERSPWKKAKRFNY